MRALWIVPLLAGCVVSPGAHPDACGEGGSCPAGRRCVQPDGIEPGFCVPDEGALDAGPGDAGSGEQDAGDAGAPDAGCVSVTETCDGTDEDCDDDVDEDFDLMGTEHCGRCNNPCTPPNDMCLPVGDGTFACGSDCDRTRFTDCGPDLCVDVMTDERHCGACGNQCDDGEDCVDGACSCGGAGPDCAGDTTSTCCGTRCVDLNTDADHCGACRDACAGGVSCSEQTCGCGDCREPGACVALACVGG